MIDIVWTHHRGRPSLTELPQDLYWFVGLLIYADNDEQVSYWEPQSMRVYVNGIQHSMYGREISYRPRPVDATTQRRTTRAPGRQRLAGTSMGAAPVIHILKNDAYGSATGELACDRCNARSKHIRLWSVSPLNYARPGTWGTFLDGRTQRDLCPTCKETKQP